MALTQYYVDPAIAGNSGTGTIGDPFGDLQYALNTITRDSTNGDQINVKAGTAEVLAAALTLATYGTPVSDAPLVIRGYTSAANDGGEGAISAATYATFAATYNAIGIVDMYIYGSVAAAYLVTVGSNSLIYRSRLIWTRGASWGGALSIGAQGIVLESYISADNVSGGGNVIQTSTVIVCGCYIVGGTGGTRAILLNAYGGVVTNNIIMPGSANNGITSQGWAYIANNTIYATAGSTYTGIYLGAYNNEQSNVVVNNIISNFSGVGGTAIGIGSSPDFPHIIIGNAIHNCANGIFTDAYGYVQTNNDTIASDPFVNAATGDFDINGTVTGITEEGYPSTWLTLASTVSKPDKGAVQAGNSAPAATLILEAGGGTYHAPDQAEVLDSAVYGPSSGTSGTYHAPDVGEVIDTAVFGPSSGTAGTFAVPPVNKVEDGYFYGEDGTEYEGTLTAGGGGGAVAIKPIRGVVAL